MADELSALNSVANNGRGVSCVKTIIYYLNYGNLSIAQIVARSDSDKLWAYPEIRKYIHDNLIGYWDEKLDINGE